MNAINLNRETTYSENELVNIVKSANPSMSSTKVKWTLFELEKNNVITRVGTKKYVTSGNRYSAELSVTARLLDLSLRASYPDVRYVLWESAQLNEWANFLMAKNIIFVEVEPEVRDYVFTFVQQTFGRSSAVLLNPTIDVLSRYIDNAPIVVRLLFSRSPQKKNSHRITLEKLMVDVLSDRLLGNLIGTNDRYEIVRGIIRSYSVNETTALAYAKRRKCEAELREIWENAHD